MFFAALLLSGGKKLLDLQKELDEAELQVTQPPTVRSPLVHKAAACRWGSIEFSSEGLCTQMADVPQEEIRAHF